MFKWQFVLFTVNYKHILQIHSQSMYITPSHSVLKLRNTPRKPTSSSYTKSVWDVFESESKKTSAAELEI